MKKQIMERAWEIAKEAVIDFGGKSVEYLGNALKMAWAEVKEQMQELEELAHLSALHAEESQQLGTPKVAARKLVDYAFKSNKVVLVKLGLIKHLDGVIEKLTYKAQEVRPDVVPQDVDALELARNIVRNSVREHGYAAVIDQMENDLGPDHYINQNKRQKSMFGLA